MTSGDKYWNPGSQNNRIYEHPDALTNHFTFRQGTNVAPYSSPWQVPEMFPSPVWAWHSSSNVLPLGYNHFAPNVSPFTHGYEHTQRPSSLSPDKEVSFYSNVRSSVPDLQATWCTDNNNRCSSTDTSVSVTSNSTCVSRASTETNEEEERATPVGRGTKRKKKRSDKPKKTKKSSEEKVKYMRHAKPPYTYTGLIVTAIWNSPTKELTLRDIQTKLMDLFPFFNGPYTGWRDSVRHNLSHHRCFIKRIDHSDKRRPRMHLWSVDYSKVTSGLFVRQENNEGKSGLYKPTIHEHLGLPPVPILTEGQSEVEDRNDDDRNNDDGRDAYQSCTTPCVVKSSDFNVNLPEVDPCFSQSDSPYQFSRRDSLPCHLTFSQGESSPVDSSWHMEKVKDLVRLEKRTSLDALQHLHSLCFMSPEETPQVNWNILGTEVPNVNPLPCDSGVQAPINSCAEVELPVSPYTRDSDVNPHTDIKAPMSSYAKVEPPMSPYTRDSDVNIHTDVRVPIYSCTKLEPPISPYTRDSDVQNTDHLYPFKGTDDPKTYASDNLCEIRPNYNGKKDAGDKMPSTSDRCNRQPFLTCSENASHKHNAIGTSESSSLSCDFTAEILIGPLSPASSCVTSVLKQEKEEPTFSNCNVSMQDDKENKVDLLEI